MKKAGCIQGSIGLKNVYRVNRNLAIWNLCRDGDEARELYLKPCCIDNGVQCIQYKFSEPGAMGKDIKA